jgi:hypothetical protein
MKAPPFPLSSRPKRSAAERSEVLLRTQGDENASVQQALPTNRRPLLVIPSEGEGSAVPFGSRALYLVPDIRLFNRLG